MLAVQAFVPAGQRLGAVISLAVGTDGKTLVTGHSDCTAHIWQARGGGTCH
jgi:hypothetical protein